MSFHEEFERDREAVCRPIRESVGINGKDIELEDLSEHAYEYIMELERALTAERRVRRMVGPNSEYLLRAESRALDDRRAG